MKKLLYGFRCFWLTYHGPTYDLTETRGLYRCRCGARVSHAQAIESVQQMRRLGDLPRRTNQTAGSHAGER